MEQKEYKVVCEIDLVPYLKKYGCITQEIKSDKSVFITTKLPKLCQTIADLVYMHEAPKLLFGDSYSDIMQGKYFTV